MTTLRASSQPKNDNQLAPAATQLDGAVQRCAVTTTTGRRLTAGVAVVIDRGGAIEVRMTELSEPGALLNAVFGRGARRFRITFENGSQVDADLIDTSWQTSGRRVCRFAVRQAAVTGA